MEKKMVKKLLVLLMLITILATDFFVLGSNLITYATQINSSTNNANIEFSAYFKNGNQRIDSIEKSIKSEDLKLYAEIKVKNEGYFNGTIEILDSNFNLKNDILSSAIASIDGNKINLKQINAGDVIEIEVGIEPVMTDKIAVDMLTKTSTVKLTGTYMEATYEGLNIQAEKSVNVTYKVDETAEAELEPEIITNQVFAVNETTKRIVQLSVKSKLTDNQYPIQQTKLNIDAPQLSGVIPEEVNVMAIGELATNGATEISSENYTYKNGTVQIILNNSVDANNQISWSKDVYDELVITFIYPEDVDANDISITANSEIIPYGYTNSYTANRASVINNGMIQTDEPNSIIMARTEITTSEIYKGQLYANINATEKQDVPYNTITTLIVTNPNVAEEIVINEGPDAFETTLNGTSQDERQNTKYLTTEINLNKMLAILGPDGNIEIKNGETTTLINKDTTVNEAGNVVIIHNNSTNRLDITTSNPVNQGVLEIKHQKAIVGNNIFSNTRERIETLKSLISKVSIVGNITVEKEKVEIVKNSTEASIELKETITKAELIVDKQNLSTIEANNVSLGIKLVTDDVKYDLYKNPTIKIQLPEAVESVTLNEAPSKLYADELNIKDSGYNPETKTIEIILDGEQTTYPESSVTQAYLRLNLNIKLSQLAPSQNDKIVMTYTNENASQYDGGTTDVGVIEKAIGISAPVGLIKTFNLSVEENTSLSEKVIKQITSADAGKTFKFETKLVNNTDSNINNVRILGKLPTTGNMIEGEAKENTLETTLTSIVAPNAGIYYTENVDATADIDDTTNGWTRNLADLTNAKMYLIKIESLSKANSYDASVNIQIPNITSRNVTSYAQYEVIYDTDVQSDIEEASRKIGLTASVAEGLDVELTAEVGQDVLKNGDTVKVGEVIKYTATLKNEGTKKLENIELKLNVPDGTVLVQPMEDYVYANGYYEEKEDKETTKTVTLEAGKSYAIQYEVRVKTGVAGGSEILNKAEVTYNGLTMETDAIKNLVAESNVRVSIKKLNDLSIQLLPGGSAKYKLYVENLTNQTIKNVNLKIQSDEYDVTSIIYIPSGSEYENDNITDIHIDEISANGVYDIVFEGKIHLDVLSLALSVNVVDDNNNIICKSNVVKEVFPYTDATISMSSPQSNAKVQDGDIVEYNILAKNIGNTKETIKIYSEISHHLEIQAIYINKQLIKQITDSNDLTTYVQKIESPIEEIIELEPEKEVQLDIVTKVLRVHDEDESEEEEIYSKSEVSIKSITKNKSEEIKHILVNPKPVEDLKNIVSGMIWLDENENGKKDSNEKSLKDVVVALYDISSKNYLVDFNGDIIRTVTNDAGEYSFTKILEGQYMVFIGYDISKYEISENSIVKKQEVLIDGGMTSIIATDIIDVNDNISDINVALKEKEVIPPVEEPEKPETPEIPEKPNTPEKPENPEQPETPNTPEKPENSEQPETPYIPEIPDTPEKPETPEKPGDSNEKGDTKSISGYVWLDEDRDGEKDSGEVVLSDIKVRIYSVLTKDYLKDDNGNIIGTTTDNNGQYTFNNIEKGSYIILFEYDTEKYETTTYFAQGIDTTKNSKAIFKNININGQELKLAVTDTINVQDNVSNINLGLKENLKFDLELNKYISKIVVQNSKETKTNEYEDKSFAKVEIHRKQVSGSLVVLEYTIKVKNTGEITGYAKNIVDYIPNGLTFSSELNKDWYVSGDYLYTKGLENVEINPGEEKEIKLILTKTMTNENTGLINNRAEIYQAYNKYGEVDIDSTPNNQVQDEDDFSSVDTIIGIKTGGNTIANIILLIINLVLIGIVINLMIRNGIIKIPNKKERR